VFRAEEIPREWTKQLLSERLQQSFPGHDFQVDSLCRHFIRPLSTALVTFNSTVPEGLSTLNNGSDRVIELDIGGCQIIFCHCLNLTTLFEPSEGESLKADFIFVHGLNGHAIGSWTAPNGKCWPRDFLGHDLAGLRILSFGYEANLKFDTSTSQLSDFGLQLIEQLLILRPTTEDKERPLFLVGHSFGGTIINWTLHRLWSRQKCNTEYGQTLSAIRCAAFFGTPHQGMNNEPLEPLTLKRIHSSMTRTLRDLQPDSELLKMLRDTLTELSPDIRFITCVEQKLTLAPLIDGQRRENYHAVDMNGARIYSQSEDIIPIQGDHREMIKFSYKGDMHYQQVLRQLRRSLDNCGALTVEQMQAFLNSLRFSEIEERQMTIKNAYEMTCDWLFECPEYLNWSLLSSNVKKEDPFLWIKGNAGSGKSTLMKFAFTYHRKRQSDDPIIAFFFNAQGTDLQKTAKGMYRSLLLQILQGTERIPCEVYALKQSMRGGFSTWQTYALKELLEYFIPRSGRPLFCFIDALDECQSFDVREVYELFKRLAELCAEKQTIFRVCFSSRHNLDIPAQNCRVVCLEEQEGHSQDILRYIEHKLQIRPGEPAQATQQALKRKASGVFLWAMLVVGILNKDSDRGRRSFRERLDRIPADLYKLYRHVLTQEREKDSKDKLLLCLQWVLFAKRPHKPMELYFAILSGASPEALRTVRECAQNQPTEDLAGKFVLDASKGLVEITRADVPVVQFVHESVPEFLHSDEAISQIWKEHRSVFRGKSHNRLKHYCLRFLEGLATPVSGNPDEVEFPSYRRWKVPPLIDPLSIFATYAVENILYHANEAERDGVTQAQFLQYFPLTQWIQLANTLSDQRVYTPKASLLYILAEQNMSELIAAHPCRFSYLYPEQELYGSPFFVALAKANIETIRS
ncbi:uncharacterized protein K441DRAFT_741253, partial [Cenococcum geophilum 1.58]|uniref:uncharacterized protein n=1 Tax=Cenococcum geophilum 1.58 TaxID=794803 RepID=UPI00358F7A5D